MRVDEKVKLNGGKELRYTHIQNNSKKVCFMLSGAGYTYDKPLFYYSTMKLLEENTDIIHLHYNYSKDELDLPISKLSQLITCDVKQIIKDVLKNNDYEEKIFLGKSLGTIPIIDQLLTEYRESKFVLLTPLLKYDVFMEPLLETHCNLLIIVGEKDHHFFVDKVEALNRRENITVKKLQGVNHSLELEPFNTLESIAVLRETIHSINNYLSWS